MTPLFKKLNLKNHKQINILNDPESFSTERDEISKEITVYEKETEIIEFILIFVTSKKVIKEI